MKITILDDKKSSLTFELDGVSATYLTMLKSELWNDKNVKVATFSVRHPTASKPKFILETSGSEPRKALSDAISRLKKTGEKFKKDVLKEVA